jgi:hypothetical protein
MHVGLHVAVALRDRAPEGGERILHPVELADMPASMGERPGLGAC